MCPAAPLAVGREGHLKPNLLEKKCSSNRLSKCTPQISSTASPGSLSKMQVLGLYPRPSESETLGQGPEVCMLVSPLGDSAVGSRLRCSRPVYG